MTIRAPRSHHEMVDLLQGVLDHAHSSHIYKTDQDQYGQQEFWTPNTLGDCEDFALFCRAFLKKTHGLDSDLIFCLTEQGEGHLVLSYCGWILDNRSVWVTRRDALPYRWIALGGPGPDFTWRRILSAAGDGRPLPRLGDRPHPSPDPEADTLH